MYRHVHLHLYGLFLLGTLILFPFLIFTGCDCDDPAAPQTTPPPPEISWLDTTMNIQGVITLRFAVIGETPRSVARGYIDGRQVWEEPEPAGDTLSFEWNSRTVEDGPHTVEARVWDRNDLVGVSPNRMLWVENDTSETPASMFQWIDLPASPWNGQVDLSFVVYSDNELEIIRFRLDADKEPLDSIANPGIDDTLTWTWNTGNHPDGFHLLYAELQDMSGGKSFSSPVPVELLNNETPAPTFQWINLPASPWNTQVELRYVIHADNVINNIRFRIDADREPLDSVITPAIGDTLTWTWNTENHPDGFHLLYAELEDLSGGKSYSSPLPVELRNADRTPPVVRWLYPEAGGRLQGIVGLPFYVEDEGGIRSIRIFRNGLSEPGDTLEEVGTGNMMYQWDSETVNDGFMTFEVFVYDSAGNEGRSPVLLAETINQSLPQVIEIPTDYAIIQSGINAAKEGDTIRVLPGTYNEGLNFFGKNIWFESTDGPEMTIIDASGWARAIYIVHEEDTTLVIRGFTLQNAEGEGIAAFQGSFKVINCIFKNNWEGIRTGHSETIILNCLFTDMYYGMEISYSWGRLINNIIIRQDEVGLWSAAGYSNPVYHGYNLLYDNSQDFFNFEPTEGYIFEDPLFLQDSYHLDVNSPCIDAGHPNILDIDETQSDIGVYGGPFAY
ncbi:MAG: NosD domain-containing protein [Candidatus Electryonea clarkiae]|nr:NosD domain-containing protein [Candidatus Electryonea clarkiae]MDP8286281.1 NosD domain-containing protein [Candidatus Electryonea clarkiae]